MMTTKLVSGFACDCVAGESDEEGHLIHHQPMTCSTGRKVLVEIPTDPDWRMPPWRASHEVIEQPAPEVPGRLAHWTEVPSAARKMASLASTHGFTGVITYARGVGKVRQPPKAARKRKEGEADALALAQTVTDSILLRAASGESRCAAVWESRGSHAARCPDGCQERHYGSAMAYRWTLGGARHRVSFVELASWIKTHEASPGARLSEIPMESQQEEES